MREMFGISNDWSEGNVKCVTKPLNSRPVMHWNA